MSLIHDTGQKKEDEADVLRSILSQLDFTYTVRKYDAEGVPFRSNLHVPETHPITGVMFCEREDHGHVLKVRVVCDTVHKHYRYTIQKSLRELLSVPGITALRESSWRDSKRLSLIRRPT